MLNLVINGKVVVLPLSTEEKLKARPRPNHEILREELFKDSKKYCPQCEVIQDTAEFTKNKARKDGLKAYCKSCCKTNRETNKEYNNAQSKEWRKANPERFKERRDAWSKKHVDKERIRLRETTAKRRAIIKSSEHLDLAAIIVRDNGICYLCNEPIEPGYLHFDHVIPLAAGGLHTMDNVKITHASCNLIKSADDKKLVQKVTATLKAG